jgi:hypothetical protein
MNGPSSIRDLTREVVIQRLLLQLMIKGATVKRIVRSRSQDLTTDPWRGGGWSDGGTTVVVTDEPESLSESRRHLCTDGLRSTGVSPKYQTGTGVWYEVYCLLSEH